MDEDKDKSADNSKDSFYDKFQYCECQGYGHLQRECPTSIIKKKHVALVVNHNDSDSNKSDTNEKKFVALTTLTEDSLNPIVALTGITNDTMTEEEGFNHESDGEQEQDPTDKDIAKNYAEVFQRWKDSFSNNIKQLGKNAAPKVDKRNMSNQIGELEAEIVALKLDKHKLSQENKRLNTAIDQLGKKMNDEIKNH